MRTFLRSDAGVLRRGLPAAVLAAVIVAGCHLWRTVPAHLSRDQFVSGTGRIEGAEMAVATRLPGRVENILVAEGQFVRAGQVLVRMQIQNLLDERDEAYARYRQAHYAAAVAETEIVLRETQTRAAEATVRQRNDEFESVVQSLTSAVRKAQQGAGGEQELEDQRAAARRAAAAASAADAQWATATVAVSLARMQLASARSGVAAAEAAIRRVEAELADTELKAPRDAVVQYRLARAGEVLEAGGRILSLVDPADVTLTFLVPEAVCRRVAVGSEARIMLDGAPQSIMPATVSSIGSAGRLVPSLKSASASGDSMCRVTARLDPELVQQYSDQVKTGAAGIGWVKLDPQIRWPPALAVSW